jgi:hypothetical protein
MKAMPKWWHDITTDDEGNRLPWYSKEEFKHDAPRATWWLITWPFRYVWGQVTGAFRMVLLILLVGGIAIALQNYGVYILIGGVAVGLAVAGYLYYEGVGEGDTWLQRKSADAAEREARREHPEEFERDSHE